MSIEVSEYSKQSGRPIFEIIEDIQEGRMMGHKVGERWYVGEGNDVDVPSVPGEKIEPRTEPIPRYLAARFIASLTILLGFVVGALTVGFAGFMISSGRPAILIFSTVVGGGLASTYIIANGQIIQMVADIATNSFKALKK